MDGATIALLSIVLGGPVGGAIAARYIKPKASLPERLGTLENDFRVLQDYTHQLRQHIADGKPPPPPPWPKS